MTATGPFGQHEVLHVASIIADMWETWILEHDATKADPTLLAEADAISEMLYNFYQRCGRTFTSGEREPVD